ncbi:MAG: glycine cleavage system aminomethyltransferase T [Myxococcota bacterium]
MTPGVRAVRQSVALTALSHVAVVALRGPDAIEVLDRAVPKELFLRDGDVLQTLFLRDDGTVLADVLAVADEQDFLLLIEGLGAAEAVAHLEGLRGPDEDAAATDLSAEASLLGIDGPYAWELLATVVGAEVVGLPYLHAVALDRGEVLVRAGKTGEFGYIVLAEPAVLAERVAELEAAGAALDLGWATVEDLDGCAVENGFFTPRTPGLADLDPAALQLQWRVSPAKESYIGAPVVRALLATEVPQRLCMLVGGEAEEGSAVLHDGQAVGRVLSTVHAPTANRPLVLALVDGAVAHPGQRFDAGMELQAVTLPLVNNRSLYVDPQKHTYAGRAADTFPDVA